MDEEISIINVNKRNEKVKNYFTKNKKILIIGTSILIILIIGYLSFDIAQKKKKLI